MLQAHDIIDRVRYTLLDTGKDGWSDAELISYLNSALAQLIVLKPDAIPTAELVSLAPGALQDIPDDGVVFITALYNGHGESVTVQSLAEMSRTNPDWAAAEHGSPLIVMYDTRIPTSFWVSPPADSGRNLWILYGAQANTITGLNTQLGCPDKWQHALWAGVVGMAYAKNSTRQNLAKSAQFLALFEHYIVGATPALLAAGAKDDIRGEL